MEYADSTPTLRVSGIGVELSVLTPAAIGLGISVKRGNGGLDSVVKLWEIISVFISVFPCVGIPAPRGVGEFGGVMVGRSSAGSWERSRYAIAVGSYTPAQGDGRGLPRPRQIPSPPGGPWMNF